MDWPNYTYYSIRTRPSPLKSLIWHLYAYLEKWFCQMKPEIIRLQYNMTEMYLPSSISLLWSKSFKSLGSSWKPKLKSLAWSSMPGNIMSNPTGGNWHSSYAKAKFNSIKRTPISVELASIQWKFIEAYILEKFQICIQKKKKKRKSQLEITLFDVFFTDPPCLKCKNARKSGG